MERHGKVRPTGVLRTFGDDEIIVTKTDLKGRITYANDVFLRVSAYSEHEAMGQPQNLIRHPDMPAGVFKLLWDELEGGREIFAYVLNLAADGAHYWVFAHVTPSTDMNGNVVGYHSSRRTATPAAISRLQPIYQRVRAAERRQQRASEAARVGLDLLGEILTEQGLGYDEWVWTLASAKVSVAA